MAKVAKIGGVFSHRKCTIPDQGIISARLCAFLSLYTYVFAAQTIAKHIKSHKKSSPLLTSQALQFPFGL